MTADQRLLRATTTEFLERDSPVTTVRELHDAGRGFDPAWWKRAAELGWVSLLVPEELGGGSVSGEAVVDATIVAEVMGRFVAPGPFIVTNVVAAALADAKAHAPVVRVLLAGEAVATWACYAPDRG